MDDRRLMTRCRLDGLLNRERIVGFPVRLCSKSRIFYIERTTIGPEPSSRILTVEIPFLYNRQRQSRIHRAWRTEHLSPSGACKGKMARRSA